MNKIEHNMCRVLSPIYFVIICFVISEYFISEKNIPILLKCDELKKPIYLEFVLNDIFQKDLFSVMDQIGIQILYIHHSFCQRNRICYQSSKLCGIQIKRKFLRLCANSNAACSSAC